MNRFVALYVIGFGLEPLLAEPLALRGLFRRTLVGHTTTGSVDNAHASALPHTERWSYSIDVEPDEFEL